jgi:hypothetical protein
VVDDLDGLGLDGFLQVLGRRAAAAV